MVAKYMAFSRLFVMRVILLVLACSGVVQAQSYGEESLIDSAKFEYRNGANNKLKIYVSKTAKNIGSSTYQIALMPSAVVEALVSNYGTSLYFQNADVDEYEDAAFASSGVNYSGAAGATTTGYKGYFLKFKYLADMPKPVPVIVYDINNSGTSDSDIEIANFDVFATKGTRGAIHYKQPDGNFAFIAGGQDYDIVQLRMVSGQLTQLNFAHRHNEKGYLDKDKIEGLAYRPVVKDDFLVKINPAQAKTSLITPATDVQLRFDLKIRRTNSGINSVQAFFGEGTSVNTLSLGIDEAKYANKLSLANFNNPYYTTIRFKGFYIKTGGADSVYHYIKYVGIEANDVLELPEKIRNNFVSSPDDYIKNEDLFKGVDKTNLYYSTGISREFRKYSEFKKEDHAGRQVFFTKVATDKSTFSRLLPVVVPAVSSNNLFTKQYYDTTYLTTMDVLASNIGIRFKPKTGADQYLVGNVSKEPFSEEGEYTFFSFSGLNRQKQYEAFTDSIKTLTFKPKTKQAFSTQNIRNDIDFEQGVFKKSKEDLIKAYPNLYIKVQKSYSGVQKSVYKRLVEHLFVKKDDVPVYDHEIFIVNPTEFSGDEIPFPQNPIEANYKKLIASKRADLSPNSLDVDYLTHTIKENTRAGNKLYLYNKGSKTFVEMTSPLRFANGSTYIFKEKGAKATVYNHATSTDILASSPYTFDVTRVPANTLTSESLFKTNQLTVDYKRGTVIVGAGLQLANDTNFNEATKFYSVGESIRFGLKDTLYYRLASSNDFNTFGSVTKRLNHLKRQTLPLNFADSLEIDYTVEKATVKLPPGLKLDYVYGDTLNINQIKEIGPGEQFDALPGSKLFYRIQGRLDNDTVKLPSYFIKITLNSRPNKSTVTSGGLLSFNNRIAKAFASQPNKIAYYEYTYPGRDLIAQDTVFKTTKPISFVIDRVYQIYTLPDPGKKQFRSDFHEVIYSPTPDVSDLAETLQVEDGSSLNENYILGGVNHDHINYNRNSYVFTSSKRIYISSSIKFTEYTKELSDNELVSFVPGNTYYFRVAPVNSNKFPSRPFSMKLLTEASNTIKITTFFNYEGGKLSTTQTAFPQTLEFEVMKPSGKKEYFSLSQLQSPGIPVSPLDKVSYYMQGDKATKTLQTNPISFVVPARRQAPNIEINFRDRTTKLPVPEGVKYSFDNLSYKESTGKIVPLELSASNKVTFSYFRPSKNTVGRHEGYFGSDTVQIVLNERPQAPTFTVSYVYRVATILDQSKAKNVLCSYVNLDDTPFPLSHGNFGGVDAYYVPINDTYKTECWYEPSAVDGVFLSTKQELIKFDRKKPPYFINYIDAKLASTEAHDDTRDKYRLKGDAAFSAIPRGGLNLAAYFGKELEVFKLGSLSATQFSTDTITMAIPNRPNTDNINVYKIDYTDETIKLIDVFDYEYTFKEAPFLVNSQAFNAYTNFDLNKTPSGRQKSLSKLINVNVNNNAYIIYKVNAKANSNFESALDTILIKKRRTVADVSLNFSVNTSSKNPVDGITTNEVVPFNVEYFVENPTSPITYSDTLSGNGSVLTQMFTGVKYLFRAKGVNNVDESKAEFASQNFELPVNAGTSADDIEIHFDTETLTKTGAEKTIQYLIVDGTGIPEAAFKPLDYRIQLIQSKDTIKPSVPKKFKVQNHDQYIVYRTLPKDASAFPSSISSKKISKRTALTPLTINQIKAQLSIDYVKEEATLKYSVSEGLKEYEFSSQQDFSNPALIRSFYTTPKEIKVVPGERIYIRKKGVHTASTKTFASLPFDSLIKNRPTLKSSNNFIIDYDKEIVRSNIETEKLQLAVNDVAFSGTPFVLNEKGKGAVDSLVLTDTINYFTARNKSVTLYLRIIANNTTKTFGSEFLSKEIPMRRSAPKVSINYLDAKTFEIIPRDIQFSTTSDFKTIINGENKEINLLKFISTEEARNLYFRKKYNSNESTGQLHVHSKVLHLPLLQQPKLEESQAKEAFKISYKSQTYTFKELYNSSIHQLSLKDSIFTSPIPNISDVPLVVDTAYYVRIQPSNVAGSERFPSNLVKFTIPKLRKSPGYELLKISESLKLPTEKLKFPVDTFDVYYGSTSIASAKVFPVENFSSNILRLEDFGEFNQINTIFLRLKGIDNSKTKLLPSEFDTIKVGRRFTPASGTLLKNSGGKIRYTVDYETQKIRVYLQKAGTLDGFDLVYATKSSPLVEHRIKLANTSSHNLEGVSYPSFNIDVQGNDQVTFKYLSTANPDLYPSTAEVLKNLPLAKSDIIVTFDPNRMRSDQTFLCVPPTHADFVNKTLGTTIIKDITDPLTPVLVTNEMLDCSKSVAPVNNFLDFSSKIGKTLSIQSHFTGNSSTPSENHFRSPALTVKVPSRVPEVKVKITYSYGNEAAAVDYDEQKKVPGYKDYMNKMAIFYAYYTEDKFGKLSYDAKNWKSVNVAKDSDDKLPVNLTEILNELDVYKKGDVDSFYVEMYRVGDFVTNEKGRDTVFFSSLPTLVKLPLRPTINRASFNIDYIREQFSVLQSEFTSQIKTSSKTFNYTKPVSLLGLFGTPVTISFLGSDKLKQFGTEEFVLQIPQKESAEVQFAHMTEYDYVKEETKSALSTTSQFRFLDRPDQDVDGDKIAWSNGSNTPIKVIPGKYIQYRSLARDPKPGINELNEDEQFATKPYTVRVATRDTLRVLGKGNYVYIDYTSEESRFSISSDIQYWAKDARTEVSTKCPVDKPCKFDQSSKIPLRNFILDEKTNKMYMRKVASNGRFKSTIDSFTIPARINLDNVGTIDYVKEIFRFDHSKDLNGMIVVYNGSGLTLSKDIDSITLNPEIDAANRKISLTLPAVQTDNDEAKKGQLGRFRSLEKTITHPGRDPILPAQQIEQTHVDKFNFLTGEYTLVDGYEYSTTTVLRTRFIDSVTVKDKNKFVIDKPNFSFFYRLAAKQAEKKFASVPTRIEFKDKFRLNEGAHHKPEVIREPYNYKQSYFILKNSKGTPTHKFGLESDYEFSLENVSPFHTKSIPVINSVTDASSYVKVEQSKPLYFRKKGFKGSSYSTSRFPSEVLSITVPSGPLAPNFLIDFLNETTATPVTGIFEYRKNDESNYTTGSGVLRLETNNTYYIRVKATETAFNGFDQKLVIPERPAPDFAFTLTADLQAEITVQSIPDTIEYRYGTDLFYKAGKNKPIQATIGSTIFYRRRAQPAKNKFASKSKELNVKSSALSDPKTLKYSLVDEVIYDVTEELEYMWSSIYVTQDFKNNRNAGTGIGSGDGNGIEVPLQTGLYFVYNLSPSLPFFATCILSNIKDKSS